MPLYKTIKVTEQHVVALWRIEESVAFLMDSLHLSAEGESILESFKLDKRKKEWLVSRLLLKELLEEYPHVRYGHNGKPELSNRTEYISISHCDSMVAVSVSNKPTALDIEVCGSRVERVANRFVHTDENKYIQEKSLRTYLTILWSAKEALYKYYNVAGVIFNEQFKISAFDIQNDGILQSEFINDGVHKKMNLNYVLLENFVLVYC
ncbi:4'-phosphopantetheinyl transferase superfamily protein [Carboxylicivirga sp. M1479]|uniref:4'-phosphopantetheinyl transferase superfamily protein n=1 Tax=Carboxylicivirga sp. M1479 TaxID=2594476 RepID=UPI0011780983|nr:4'-phosphopantetheinyl transferase superfamily protein [Carboxylicivirga sp. M1479]TRX72169.1 4'-phosphopantetheinyl transferase superfamily protein [Carboxylicivirga sp. M1479]